MSAFIRLTARNPRLGRALWIRQQHKAPRGRLMGLGEPLTAGSEGQATVTPVFLTQRATVPGGAAVLGLTERPDQTVGQGQRDYVI